MSYRSQFFIAALFTGALAIVFLSGVTDVQDRVHIPPATTVTLGSTSAPSTTVPLGVECVDAHGFKIRTDRVSAVRRHLDCKSPQTAGTLP